MKAQRWTTLLLATLLCASCGGDATESGNNANNANNANNSNNANNMADAGLDAASDANTSNNNTVPDMTANNAVPDMGDDTSTQVDMGPDYGRTLPNYRRCTTDADCPVGLGTCITELPLNRADANGTDRVAMSDVFDGLNAGEGVCSALCTINAAACDDLSVNGASPDAEPYECQVVYEAASPYPGPRPAFPFDGDLVPADLAAGVPFGAICRPPFQLDPAIDRGFCAECVGGADACAGNSVCWSFSSGAEAATGEAGSCLAPCDDGICPFGFECTALGGADLCKPVADTCAFCRDLDGDGRGVGRCGDVVQPVTPIDCDDFNADAYYDPTNMGHAFPTHCGPDNDFNCNGKSDEAEQVGSVRWGGDHCSACGDSCNGPVTNGTLACVQNSCEAICEITHASCDDDPRNGCEQAVTDTSRTYYRDADEDSYGDLNVPQFACDPNIAPAGFVDNSDDCNDMSADALPGGLEVCDGLDNDCNMSVDDGVLYRPDGSLNCAAAAMGECAKGTARCDGTNGWVCDAAAPGTETCNGLDDDCDGQIDLSAGAAPADALTWYPDCDRDGYGDMAVVGVQQCVKPTSRPASCRTNVFAWVANAGDCDDTKSTINPGVKENCNTPTVDENCKANDTSSDWVNQKPYYYDFDGDGYSSNPGNATTYCTPPDKWSVVSSSDVDCNDTDAAIRPNGPEICATAYDDNCNGDLHDATTGYVTRYRDIDMDGYGATASQKNFCQISLVASDYTTYNSDKGADCNDTTTTLTVSSNNHKYTGADQTPMRAEYCDGFDNDCEGGVDEGCPSDFSLPASTIRNQETQKGSTTVNTNLDCPSGKVVSGLRVRGKIPVGLCKGTTGVFGIHLICTDPNIAENKNDDPFSYSTSNASSSETAVIGKVATPDGGCYNDTITDNTLNCASNQSLRGIQGNSGNWIDRIGPVCVTRSLQYSVTPATLSLATKNDVTAQPQAATGGSAYRLECANNEVMVGVRYAKYSSGQLASIMPRCIDMTLLNK